MACLPNLSHPVPSITLAHTSSSHMLFVKSLTLSHPSSLPRYPAVMFVKSVSPCPIHHNGPDIQQLYVVWLIRHPIQSMKLAQTSSGHVVCQIRHPIPSIKLAQISCSYMLFVKSVTLTHPPSLPRYQGVMFVKSIKTCPRHPAVMLFVKSVTSPHPSSWPGHPGVIFVKSITLSHPSI